jgi:hypothetical protein
MSFLPVPDISTFRLLNKACAKVGERNPVENLHVMFNAKSLQNLLHLSRHPSLCRYVSSIVYEVRYLEDVEIQEHESNILDNDGLEESTWISDAGSGDSKERIAKGWKAYKPMLDEQLYMKKILRRFGRYPSTGAISSLEMTRDVFEVRNAVRNFDKGIRKYARCSRTDARWW